MIRRSSATISTLIAAAMTAAVLAGCGAATTTANPALSTGPAPSPSGVAPSAGASGSAGTPASAGPSGSAEATASSVPSATVGLSCGPHLDVKLEDLLPSTIGGVDLEKCSLALSAYVASTTGGDRALYAPWLVKFGKTPDDVTLAVAVDLTQQEHFIVHAIKVPGVDDATLSSAFAEVARQAGWPVSSKNFPTKTVLEIIDPAAQAAGELSAGYVYAKNNVLYTIITDDASLWLEALAKLP